MKKLFLMALGLSLAGLIVYAAVGTTNVNIADKSSGDFVTADEFNEITGTLRGVYNYDDGSGVHSLGLNSTPTADVSLDINGSIQIAGMPTNNPTCGANFAGTIYFNPLNKHLWGCDGADWRQLDTYDCSPSAPAANDGITYTCDGGSGTWTASGAANDCSTTGGSPAAYVSGVNVSASGTVCSSTVPNDFDCASSTCQVINNEYETRCFSGKVYYYDNCGGLQAEVESCSAGCTVVDAGVGLPDGTASFQYQPTGAPNPITYSMHPEYNNDGSGSYVDPYPSDLYSSARNAPITNANNRVAASCDGAAACGSANGVASAVAPSGAGLCSGGTASAVTGSGTTTWSWTCAEGATTDSCSSSNSSYVALPTTPTNCAWLWMNYGNPHNTLYCDPSFNGDGTLVGTSGLYPSDISPYGNAQAGAAYEAEIFNGYAGGWTALSGAPASGQGAYTYSYDTDPNDLEVGVYSYIANVMPSTAWRVRATNAAGASDWSYFSNLDGTSNSYNGSQLFTGTVNNPLGRVNLSWLMPDNDDADGVSSSSEKTIDHYLVTRCDDSDPSGCPSMVCNPGGGCGMDYLGTSNTVVHVVSSGALPSSFSYNDFGASANSNYTYMLVRLHTQNTVPSVGSSLLMSGGNGLAADYRFMELVNISTGSFGSTPSAPVPSK